MKGSATATMAFGTCATVEIVTLERRGTRRGRLIAAWLSCRGSLRLRPALDRGGQVPHIQRNFLWQML
jgi:hypothetical protein